MNKIPSRYYPAIVFLCVGIVSLIASNFVRGSVCPSMLIAGVPCPACGITRSYMLLANFDFIAAFKMFPLFWMPIAICILAYYEKLSDKIIVVFIALLIGVWVIRMIFLFPDQIPPMELNENGLLPLLLGRF